MPLYHFILMLFLWLRLTAGGFDGLATWLPPSRPVRWQCSVAHISCSRCWLMCYICFHPIDFPFQNWIATWLLLAAFGIIRDVAVLAVAPVVRSWGAVGISICCTQWCGSVILLLPPCPSFCYSQCDADKYMSCSSSSYVVGCKFNQSMWWILSTSLSSLYNPL